MTRTLESLLVGLKDEEVTLPVDSALTDMLLEIRFEATCFGYTDVEAAVDQFMAASKAGRLNHYQRVTALRALYGLMKTHDRTPAFSG